jgi:hypothetical protein
MFGKHLAQVRPEFAGLWNCATPGHQVSYEALALHGVTDHDHGLTDTRMAAQQVLDFAELDPKSSQLYLVVAATQILERAIGTVAGQIAGAVHSSAARSERVGKKTVGGLARPLYVTPSQTVTRYKKFPNHTFRNQPQQRIQ